MISASVEENRSFSTDLIFKKVIAWLLASYLKGRNKEKGEYQTRDCRFIVTISSHPLNLGISKILC